MKIFGKVIRPEVATMWVNIVGFIASLIFYLNVEYNFHKPEAQPNPLQGELVKVDSRLKEEVQKLRLQQDSLLRVIQAHEIKLTQVQAQVQKQKTKIAMTIHSDWGFLSQKQRENYTNQLIAELKNKKK